MARIGFNDRIDWEIDSFISIRRKVVVSGGGEILRPFCLLTLIQYSDIMTL